MPLISYPEAVEQIQLAIADLRRDTGRFLHEPFPHKSVPHESVSVESANGRVLAEPILADRDQPPFHRATRDGFAARSADANTHRFLRLTGQIRAGQANHENVPENQVWEIMTGAAVPDGADAVFMVEHAELANATGNEEKSVRLVPPRTLRPGENIVPRGAEARAGQTILAAGTRLSAPQIALAAQCGYPKLAVFRRPRVAILATGDELVPVAALPDPHQIRNSNSPMLAALVTEAGGDPCVLATASDTAEALDRALEEARNADLLLISGGISAGRFDLVDQALDRAGAAFHFRGVAMQPGKPVAFGTFPGRNRKRVPVFALPGNPISSAVTFRLFAAPILAALGGETDPRPRFAQATLSEDWTGQPGLTRFLPAVYEFGLSENDVTVRTIPWQGSGDLAAFARSNCCLVIPAESVTIPAGASVRVLLN
jgi:molybdopterin molybdotransferase